MQHVVRAVARHVHVGGGSTVLVVIQCVREYRNGDDGLSNTYLVSFQILPLECRVHDAEESAVDDVTDETRGVDVGDHLRGGYVYQYTAVALSEAKELLHDALDTWTLTVHEVIDEFDGEQRS